MVLLTAFFLGILTSTSVVVPTFADGAILDGAFTPTVSIIQTFRRGERRFRITWRGDKDLKEQCGSLLNSFRNRAPNSQVGGFGEDQSENWQCWIAGDENGYKKYNADITLWVIKPNRMRQGPGVPSKPICQLGHDNREDIVRSLKEHFNMNVTTVNLPTDVQNECGSTPGASDHGVSTLKINRLISPGLR